MIQTSFPDKAAMAELVAKMLWEIKAVHFNATDPYKLASGMMSPVYIDCRKLISYPRIRSAVMDFAAATILSEAGFEQFDCIAGGETAGIPFAAMLAERLALPMIYVRKAPKGHGQQRPDRRPYAGRRPRSRHRGPDDRWRLDVQVHRRHPGRRWCRRSRHGPVLLRYLPRRPAERCWTRA